MRNEFFLRVFFKIALISFFKFIITCLHIKFMLEGVDQYIVGRIIKQIMGVIQLKDVCIEVEGSKIENKLFIIIREFLFYLFY